LQEEHTQYVDRTSSLLVRLQAQMQQLMKQAPGLAAGAGEELNNIQRTGRVAGNATVCCSAAATLLLLL
jgi:hypothetical protein